MDCSPPLSGRILALDVGQKRIGLAATDELGAMAHGLATYERTKFKVDVAKLSDLAHSLQARLLLIGYPRHMDGSESAQGAYTRTFAARLQERSQLPVCFWDERLTSAEAEALLRGRGQAYEKGAIDRLAAILLLEDYLAAQTAKHAAENIETA